MNRKISIVLLTVFCLVTVTGLAGCRYVSHAIKLATSSHGGAYSQVGKELCHILNKKDSALQMTVRHTSGSPANLDALNDQKVQMALVQNDVLHDHYYRDGKSSASKSNRYLAITSLYTEKLQVVARKTASIRTISDLKGKTICIGPENSGSTREAKLLLGAYGITSSNTTLKQMTYTETRNAMQDHLIDAFILMTAENTDMISKLAKNISVQVLPIKDSARKQMLKKNPYLTEASLPKSTYHGMTEEVPTVGVKCVLVVKKTLPKAAVNEIAKFIFEYNSRIEENSGVPMELNEKDAASGVSIPFHKGAAQYFKSKGVTVKTN